MRENRVIGTLDSLKTRESQLMGSVSFVELKALARKLLSQDSTLRICIMAEPDVLPREAGLAKVEVFGRLLHEEIRNELSNR